MPRITAEPARDSRRLFFSLWPSDECRAQTEAVTRALVQQSGGRIVPPRNFHVTLWFLGEVAVSRIGGIQQLAAMVAGVSPFTLAFDRIEAWSAANILALATSETPPAVIELVSKLRYCLRAEQFKWDEREFRPHVTLARDLPKPCATASIEPLRWDMNEFVLVESHRADRSYSIVGHWPLSASHPT